MNTSTPLWASQCGQGPTVAVASGGGKRIKLDTFHTTADVLAVLQVLVNVV